MVEIPDSEVVMNSPPESAPSPAEVVIAGGGVAALEGVMALRDLAGDRVRITLLSPEPDFVLRPLAVGVPFSVAHVRRYPLSEFATEYGADLRLNAICAVRPDQQSVLTTTGVEFSYDFLLVAIGAHPYPAYGNALTFGTERDPLALNGVLADLEEGYAKSVAFIVPPGVNWPLPLYELALMTARDVASMGIDDARLTIITPESAPLAVFGPEASRSVAELLDASGIEVVAGAYAEVEAGGRIHLAPGDRDLSAERIVALPLLAGSRLAGLPRDHDGFIPIDEHARVLDVDAVYAAGDGANFPIKHGGLATQQANAAAEHIAHRVGAPVDPQPFRPVLSGKLMTGGHERFLRGHIAGGGGSSEASDEPLWWPPTTVSGRYLSAWLGRQESGALAQPPKVGLDVEVSLPEDHEAAVRAALALDPLGPLPDHYRYVPGPRPAGA
ncbi:MAG TPA: FAD-dependent oxidoreductase [Solirubrobacteraceae bacterium]|nr:FAD-dependent oxidoreductase [Solirubrobacteraceae bacterium]